MIAIVDYGMGNLRSVEKAFAFLGHSAAVSGEPSILREASGIVLPGVGAFGDAMRELEKRNLVQPILDTVEAGKPVLGICLGYQLLFETSQESPGVRGLGMLPGTVKRFPARVKVPHIGWNDIRFASDNSILDGVAEGSFFYFVHSYYVQPSGEDITMTVTDYGVEFASGAARDNLIGFQFHPEKSSSDGLRLLDNFARSCSLRE